MICFGINGRTFWDHITAFVDLPIDIIKTRNFNSIHFFFLLLDVQQAIFIHIHHYKQTVEFTGESLGDFILLVEK